MEITQISPCCREVINGVGHILYEYRCNECGEWNIADETVWGEDNNPYCVSCLPNQEDDNE
jgi:hypothetical protein